MKTTNAISSSVSGSAVYNNPNKLIFFRPALTLECISWINLIRLVRFNGDLTCKTSCFGSFHSGKQELAWLKNS